MLIVSGAQEEELEPNFDYDALAALTDGYTGSDLRNLCIAAAYRPIRDFLEVSEQSVQMRERWRSGAPTFAQQLPPTGRKMIYTCCSISSAKQQLCEHRVQHALGN
jgi:SpoVK/Ycf46/Vps4 family AAA+-type ATPase